MNAFEWLFIGKESSSRRQFLSGYSGGYNGNENKNDIFDSIALFSGALAGCAGSSRDPAYVLKSGWKDKYLVTSGNMALDDDVVQSELTVLFESGLGLGLWHSLGPDGGDWNDNYGDELDYLIFWKDRCLGIDCELGLWYFDIVRIFDVPKGDILNPYLNVSKKYGIDQRTSVTPHVNFSAFYPARGVWDKGGIITWAGLTIKRELDDGFGVSFTGDIAYDDGALGNGSGLFSDCQAGLSKTLFESSSIANGKSSLTWNVIGYRLFVPYMSDKRETEQIFSSGLVFKW